ncbi:MAG: glycosyltransferase family 39 protein [Planctomycetes bacterium]|nr:glycosyltransferase family 39 protein [Planctomycetota bacterium]
MSTSSPDHVSSAPAGPSRAPLAALLVALVAFAVYLPALLHGGLVYDDVELIELNPRIRESFSLRECFTKPFWDVVDTEAEGRQPFYRPGVSLFFHLGWRLSGDQAWGYHLINLLLHVAASLGVAALARRFAGGSVLAGAAAGLLFAVQPTHHEAVAWVAGIVDPSAVAPMAWAAVLLLRARESGKLVDYAGAFALHVAALLCKETAFLFVPLCLLGARALPRATQPSRIATALVLLLPPLALYAVRTAVFGSWLAGLGYAVVDVHAGMESTRKLLFPLELLGHFVLLVLWPGAWAPMHVLRPGAGLGDPTVQLHLVLGGLFVATVLVLLGSRELGQRRSVHLFALLGFALGLAPALVSPQSLGQFPVSERYLYLPLALVCMSLGVLVARGVARRPSPRAGVPAPAARAPARPPRHAARRHLPRRSDLLHGGARARAQRRGRAHRHGARASPARERARFQQPDRGAARAGSGERAFPQRDLALHQRRPLLRRLRRARAQRHRAVRLAAAARHDDRRAQLPRRRPEDRGAGARPRARGARALPQGPARGSSREGRARRRGAGVAGVAREPGHPRRAARPPRGGPRLLPEGAAARPRPLRSAARARADRRAAERRAQRSARARPFLDRGRRARARRPRHFAGPGARALAPLSRARAPRGRARSDGAAHTGGARRDPHRHRGRRPDTRARATPPSRGAELPLRAREPPRALPQLGQRREPLLRRRASLAVAPRLRGAAPRSAAEERAQRGHPEARADLEGTRSAVDPSA